MVSEKYQDLSTYGDEARSTVRDYLHRGSDQVSHMVDERPAASLMTACLVGFGVGLLLSQIFASDEQRYSNSFDRGTAERFGRNLLDRLEHAMPTMIRERLMK